MERVARRRGKELPSRETLKARISRWENHHAAPDDFYRLLLREAFGLDDHELGFAEPAVDAQATAIEELRIRLVTDPVPDPDLLGALAGQTESVRRQDRQYGAGPLLEQMRVHVANVERHLASTALDSARRPLAQLLSDASALTAWQALDLAAADQAWRFFDLAASAARLAEDGQQYTFARLEQAHVLVDLGSTRSAADLATSTWDSSHQRVSPVMRCWLAAGVAEMLAAAGDARASRAMIAKAESLADALVGTRPPYLVFDAVHLDRWIGHTLVLLGDPEAEPRLRAVADAMDRSFMRAGAALHLDLAALLQRAGVLDEARAELSLAERMARKVGSRRQLERVRVLRIAS
jgi:hypothetical protein